MSSPDYSQAVKDIIDGLGDSPTPDEVYHAVRNYSVDYVVAAAAAKAGGGGGGGSLPDPITTPVHVHPASGAEALTVQVPTVSTRAATFGNDVWDNTDPEGCGYIDAMDTGDLRIAARYSGRRLYLGDNNGSMILAFAEPADGDLVAGESALWLDSTNGAAKLKIKAKQQNGTVVTGEIPLAP